MNALLTVGYDGSGVAMRIDVDVVAVLGRKNADGSHRTIATVVPGHYNGVAILDRLAADPRSSVVAHPDGSYTDSNATLTEPGSPAPLASFNFLD